MKNLLAAALLAAIAIPAPLTPALAQPAPATGSIPLGEYAGSYTCQDGEHGIYLDLMVDGYTDTDARISGILAFFPTIAGKDGRSGMVTGSFNVSGTLQREGLKLSLKAGEWIIQPEGYGAANLEGYIRDIDNGLTQIVGKPVVPGAPDFCSDLIATAVIHNKPVTSLAPEGGE